MLPINITTEVLSLLADVDPDDFWAWEDAFDDLSISQTDRRALRLLISALLVDI